MLQTQTVGRISAFCLLIVIFLVQFVLVDFYWNDKSTTAARLVDSMAKTHHLYASDFACYKAVGENGQYKTWGEEPPVFHMAGVYFKKIFSNLSLRILPLFCYLFIVIGLYKMTRAKSLLSFCYILFIPSIYIHASRYIPDFMSMALLIWGIYFFFKEKFLISWIILLFAVTAKVLAIIPLFFLCINYLFFYKEKRNLKKFLTLASFGLTIIPTFAWFYYLKINHIENPFFESTINFVNHTKSSEWYLLMIPKYWSKVFQWYFYRGIGIMSLLILIVGVLNKREALSRELKIYLSTALCFILNVIFFKSSQTTAPWYSFYFQIFFIPLIIYFFEKYQVKTKSFILIVHAIISIGFLKYYNNFKQPTFEEAGVEVPCNFHEYHRNLKSHL